MSLNSKTLPTTSISSNEDISDIAGLRKVALDYIRKIMNGNVDLDEVKAFCAVSNNVVSTLKVEIDYLKEARREHEIKFIQSNKTQQLIEHK